LSLQSTVTGLGSFGTNTRNNYISSSGLSTFVLNNVTSTIAGLGTLGKNTSNNYVSTASLVSTTISLSTIQSRITFTNVGTCVVNNSIVNFSSVNQLIFLSSFYYSSLSLMPSYISADGSTMTGQYPEQTTMTFSSASFNLSSFSNYIVSSSRLSLELYPTFLFSKLSDNATGPGIFPISTLIKVGNNFLSSLTTSFVVAQTQNLYNTSPGGPPGSNVFNQVIRIEIPPSSIVGDYTTDCTLIHYLPSSVAYNSFNNGVINCNYSYYFGSPGAFLTVQNSQEY
jgi:hypothetical protein